MRLAIGCRQLKATPESHRFSHTHTGLGTTPTKDCSAFGAPTVCGGADRSVLDCDGEQAVCDHRDGESSGSSACGRGVKGLSP